MNRLAKGKGTASWLMRLIGLPAAAYAYAAGKWHSLSASHHMAEGALPLVLEPKAAAQLAAEWKVIALQHKGLGQGGSEYKLEAAMPLGSWTDSGMTAYGAEGLTPAELTLVRRIRSETEALNRNNVTRTEAYRAIYGRLPELHWALLAHLVSRNGGWNMTDLQGELLPRLLGEEKREAVFRFLERANMLIFQDAYPQLLLYEASLRERRGLFHLLPSLGISRFMRPVWEQFWERRDPVPLTVALIVNEQHYIEGRVVRHPFYQQRVLHTMFFGMQSMLQLNAVVFPYHLSGELRLAGLVLENFENLQERIEFGKRLYAMLFGVAEVREGALRFVRRVRHSGSRRDYAPHLFAAVREAAPQKLYQERLSGRGLAPGAAPLYSPELGAAWQDQPLEAAEPGDWFPPERPITPYFRKLPLPRSFEMTNEYSFLLNKIELAVLAAQQLPGSSAGEQASHPTQRP
ncbi:DUF2515 domain-containing protein [Paenibacillus sp. GCM10023252]|uniref:DUF2515 domain-containing protein n=1 Tax=Paenibacillus sp. GCM10023252 TaxID=3252649 RepID=UPI0036192DDE